MRIVTIVNYVTMLGSEVNLSDKFSSFSNHFNHFLKSRSEYFMFLFCDIYESLADIEIVSAV